MLIYNQFLTGNSTRVFNLVGWGRRKPGGGVRTAGTYSHIVGKMLWYSLLDSRYRQKCHLSLLQEAFQIYNALIPS